uniref:GDT1 family protein n=1 Tax=Timema cristinae TaxID=61476 RepID=A0A7R9GZT5_TIMCR|nr:unnamed protein product [Timema cristinae]
MRAMPVLSSLEPEQPLSRLTASLTITWTSRLSEPWSFIVAERKESWEGKKGGDIPLHWNGHSSAVLAEQRGRLALLMALFLFHDVSKTWDKGHILDKADIETLDDGRGKIGNLGFIHAFVAALSVIIVSELGDKTFFIAAIMAMRHPRLTVFLGAISALAFMTILSVAFGWVATLIPRAFTYYISTALFAIFGLKMLKEGYSMSDNEGQEEFDEVQQDLRKRDDEYEKEAATSLVQDPESGVIRKTAKSSSVVGMISRIFIQSFTLTFLAEWGDRSQLATIILAAREDVVGVAVGGVLGHSLCTGLAVMGGRMIAQRISVRTDQNIRQLVESCMYPHVFTKVVMNKTVSMDFTKNKSTEKSPEKVAVLISHVLQFCNDKLFSIINSYVDLEISASVKYPKSNLHMKMKIFILFIILINV